MNLCFHEVGHFEIWRGICLLFTALLAISEVLVWCIVKQIELKTS